MSLTSFHGFRNVSLGYAYLATMLLFGGMQIYVGDPIKDLMGLAGAIALGVGTIVFGRGFNKKFENGKNGG